MVNRIVFFRQRNHNLRKFRSVTNHRFDRWRKVNIHFCNFFKNLLKTFFLAKEVSFVWMESWHKFLLKFFKGHAESLFLDFNVLFDCCESAFEILENVVFVCSNVVLGRNILYWALLKQLCRLWKSRLLPQALLPDASSCFYWSLLPFSLKELNFGHSLIEGLE